MFVCHKVFYHDIYREIVNLCCISHVFLLEYFYLLILSTGSAVRFNVLLELLMDTQEG